MNYTDKHLKRAKIAGRVLRWVSFLRMAGLNGSIVRGENSKESDIDFLIIAKAGRLYTARFFATVLIHLTGWRRYGNKVAGRICLNCYLSDKNPDIAPRNSKSREKVARAYKYLIPLVDSGNVAGRFFKVNGWMNRELSAVSSQLSVKYKKYKENLQEELAPNGPSRPVRFLEIYLKGRFGNWMEKKLMNFQIRRILAGKVKGDEIVATKSEIRLHPKKH